MASFDGTLLACLTGTEREALESRLERRVFRQSATIVWRGEILTRLFLVESGQARAEYRANRTRAELALRAGDFFGERALSEDATSDALVRADAEAAIVAFPAEAVRFLLRANPEALRSVSEGINVRRIALWSTSAVLSDLPSMN